MENQTYNDGEWVKSKNKYYHFCVVCNEGFFGRKDKIYCDKQCRNHKSNNRASAKRFKFSKMVSGSVKSAEALEACHDPKNQPTTVDFHKLYEKGFSPKTPTTPKKYMHFAGEWQKLGGYAYQVLSETEQVNILKL
jgi:hypothetical protein